MKVLSENAKASFIEGTRNARLHMGTVAHWNGKILFQFK